MRNVHTYRICALVSAACLPVAALRGEPWFVVLAGVSSLVLLRWAVVEQQREQAEAERLIAEAYDEIGTSLGGTLSHVRIVHDMPRNRFEIHGLELSTPAWRLVERQTVAPPE